MLRLRAIWLSCLVAGCSVDPISAPGDKTCPCAEGWICDEAAKRCVRRLPPRICSADTDCDAPCEAGRCVGGVCEPVVAGTPARYDKPFDCSRSVCDSVGAPVPELDPSDFFDDGDECTIEACGPEGRTVAFAPDYTPCSADGGRLCSAGACVECIDPDTCPSGDVDCIEGYCVFPYCNDGLKDTLESDVDCGSPICPPCDVGQACNDDFNCASRVCEGEVCTQSCTDAVKNGSESDIDCGGSCPPCGPYQRCNSSADCAGGTCAGVCL
jgi:hypothetical protein